MRTGLTEDSPANNQQRAGSSTLRTPWTPSPLARRCQFRSLIRDAVHFRSCLLIRDFLCRSRGPWPAAAPGGNDRAAVVLLKTLAFPFTRPSTLGRLVTNINLFLELGAPSG